MTTLSFSGTTLSLAGAPCFALTTEDIAKVTQRSKRMTDNSFWQFFIKPPFEVFKTPA
jgi:hypothetical protein